MTTQTTPAHTPDGEKMYSPGRLRARSGMPRDLIYTSIKTGSLPAYNAGRGKKPSYLVRWADFEMWRETLRVPRAQ